MDPVQLMMAAHQADATVAAQTPDQALQAAIAQSRPDLWAPLSTNPAAYPDLLGWLASTGNVEVLANLRARGYLTDDAAANAADGVGDARAVAEADSATGEPAVDPAFSQEDPAQTEPTESAEVAESVAGGGTPVDEDEAADEPGPVDGDEVEGAAGAGSGEAGDNQDAEEPGESPDAVEDVQVTESAAEAATEPDAETATGEAQKPRPDDSGDEAEGGAEDAGSGEAGVEPETEEPAEDSEYSEDVEGDEVESPASQDQRVEDAVDESADERVAEPSEAAEKSGTEASAEDSEDSDEAETAVDPDAETTTDEAADSDNNDTTVLATASQRHEVDSADTTDFTASAQSAAVTFGWTAGSAAPATGSAESVAFPVPPPPSAEDIAAWAETPSGAPSGFSAAQPAVELDMFGPQMVAQMPPPQQKQTSKSSSGRLVAIIVVLLLVIVGGGGLWAGTYFANKGKDGDSSEASQDKANSNGGEDGKQNGQVDAAATSTAAALPSGAVKACPSMPTFTITSVEDGQGELKVQGTMATSCAEGDFLAGSSNQVLIYSSTSPTGGADVDSLVASGTFDLSSEPLIIPNGGRSVTLRFGEQHYFRTAKDLELKGLSVKPSFDRGSSSSVTSKSSTNSPMTVASSTSSNANQEAQDEQAAGDAIGWQVKHDYPIVMNSMRGKWTPQLSSKQVGLVAEGQTWTNRSILAEFLKTRQANPKAVIIDTSQWPVYDVGGWWVTLSGELYDDADQANAWCDAQGYDSDHCLAKRIESNGTSQGTTKTR
ncbi:variant leucine-rich repeat-containing protein [Actinomyces oris]